MATDFSDLGMDPDDIRIDLQALGIDDSAYTDDELESLSLATNLILLQAIANKSSSVEENLTAYQIEVDITSGMQETLNDLRDYISTSDADIEDVLDFCQAEQQYMDISDASLVEIDYTYDGTTYETLQDLLDALDDPDHELLDAFVEKKTDTSSWYVTNGSGSAINSPDDDDLDALADGSYYLMNIKTDYDLYEGHVIYYDADAIKDYFIALGLQNAGYISNDVYTGLEAFGNTNQPSFAVDEEDVENYLQMVQLYFGKLTIDYDSSAGTLTMDMSGCAGMRQMGIDMGEYFADTGSTVEEFTPFSDSADDSLNRILYKYVYDDDWDDDKGNDITKKDLITDTDIDTLLQSAATAIEAQSTNAEVALLTVNSGISEWGELNDVWDLVHEYIHDSLNKASNNVV